jgi:hypothetical protein
MFLLPINVFADNYNLVLDIDGSIVKTDASISINQIDEYNKAKLEMFVKGFNQLDKNILKSFYLDGKTEENLYEYRNLYNKAFDMSGKLVYQKAFIIGNQVYLIFGLNTFSTYQNYMRFSLEKDKLVFRESELERTPLGVLLMSMEPMNKSAAKQNSSLKLANNVELKLNIDLCNKGCVNSKALGIFEDFDKLLVTNKFDKLAQYFHGRSKNKFSQWFNEIPDAEKSTSFERYFPIYHPLYILDLGPVTIVAFAKSKEDIDNFYNKAVQNIDIQHVSLLSTKSGYKVVNFYSETILDDYLKSLVLSKLKKVSNE